MPSPMGRSGEVGRTDQAAATHGGKNVACRIGRFVNDAVGANDELAQSLEVREVLFEGAFGNELPRKRKVFKCVFGVVGGALTDVLWYIFLSASTGIYEIVPGFIVGLIFAVLGTLLDKEPSKEVTDIYDKAVAMK